MKSLKVYCSVDRCISSGVFNFSDQEYEYAMTLNEYDRADWLRDAMQQTTKKTIGSIISAELERTEKCPIATNIFWKSMSLISLGAMIIICHLAGLYGSSPLEEFFVWVGMLPLIIVTSIFLTFGFTRQ